jgi:hypothetical protein
MCAGTPTTVELGGTYAGVLAHCDVAQYVGIVADKDPVANRGVALAVALAGSAQRHALVHGHVAAHNGRFADHHAGCVVNKQPATQQRTGMDVDAGEEAAHLREYPRRQSQADTPQLVGDAVNPHRPQPRIAEQDLQPGARSGIALPNRVHIFAHALEQIHGLEVRTARPCDPARLPIA